MFILLICSYVHGLLLLLYKCFFSIATLQCCGHEYRKSVHANISLLLLVSVVFCSVLFSSVQFCVFIYFVCEHEYLFWLWFVSAPKTGRKLLVNVHFENGLLRAQYTNSWTTKKKHRKGTVRKVQAREWVEKTREKQVQHEVVKKGITSTHTHSNSRALIITQHYCW